MGFGTPIAKGLEGFRGENDEEAASLRSADPWASLRAGSRDGLPDMSISVQSAGGCGDFWT